VSTIPKRLADSIDAKTQRIDIPLRSFRTLVGIISTKLYGEPCPYLAVIGRDMKNVVIESTKK